MLNHVFGVISLAHALLLARAAFGLFKFWGRTRFWLPSTFM